MDSNNRLDSRLIDVFCATFGDEHRTSLTCATSMDDISEWDSTSFLDLVFAIEEEFDVEFTPDESSQMFQLGHIQRLITAATLDIPHDDVANACCLIKRLHEAPRNAFKLVVMSGSSTREGCLVPREAEAELRKTFGPQALWFNLSVSGLVAAETLQLLEQIDDAVGPAGAILVGTSPVILSGCGEAEFLRSARYERFPFRSTAMESILSKHGYVSEADDRIHLTTIDLFAQRYLKGRDLEEMQYNPYLYPTLDPWPAEKYTSTDDLLRFYNNSVLNHSQSSQINAEFYAAIVEWSRKAQTPLALLELTLHSKAVDFLNQIGNVETEYREFLSGFSREHNVTVISAVQSAGITDADFRDPAHLFQKRHEYTAALVEGVAELRSDRKAA